MTFPTRHFRRGEAETRLIAFNIESKEPDEARLQNELADRRPGMETRNKNKMEKPEGEEQREKQVEETIDKRIADRQRKADAELAHQNSRINDTNAAQKKLEAQAKGGSTTGARTGPENKDDYAARKRANERADTAALFMEGMTGAPLLRPFEKTQTTQKSTEQPTAKLVVEADQAQQKKQDVVRATGVQEQAEKQQNA